MAIVQPSPGLTATAPALSIDPINPLKTSTTAFLGVQQGCESFEAIPVENWSEFRAFLPELPLDHVLSRAVYGFFNNGGERAYVCLFESLEEASWRAALKELEGLDELGLICAPGITEAGYARDVLEHCLIRKDCMAFLDLPEAFTDADLAALPRSKYAVSYAPWIKVRDADSGELVSQPPSGHVAGVFARVESQRGVQRPPANEALHGAERPARRFGRGEKRSLLEGGVNLISDDHRRGGKTRVWGARTLSNDASWQSLTTRRLVTMLQIAIGEGTRWAVHERNNEELWEQLRGQVTAFLEEQRASGVLAGAEASESYYVKCDGELNPVEYIGGEQVILEVGICPQRPGEFVIFRLCHWPGGLDIAE